MMTVGLGVVGSTYSFGSAYEPAGRHPARPADERARGHPGAGRLAVRDHRRPGRGVEGRPRLARRRRRLLAGRARTTCSRCSWPTRSASTPNDVNYVTVRRRRPAHQRAARREDRGRVLRAWRSSTGQIESGELRVLAVSGEERSPQDAFADVPTLTESGIDLVFLNWRGVLAPPGHQRRAPRRAHRLPRGDARQPSGRSSARDERLDRRLQDRRRLRRPSSRSRTNGCRAPSRSWG